MKLRWVVWSVALTQDGDLESFDYKVVDSYDRDKYTCSLPLVHFRELAEKYGALHVLRTPNCRPRDPEELVRFLIEGL